MRLGESEARVLLAVGAYEELGIKPTYGDIARATGRSLSRVRAIVAELLSRDPKVIQKISEDPVVRLSLTAKGWEIYRSLKKSIEGAGVLEPYILIEKFDNKIYSSSERKKFLGSVVVEIDTVVPALNLKEITKRLREGWGPRFLYGLSLELATATQIASASGIGTVEFKDLSRQAINVPIRIARVTEVSLPPHIEGVIIPLRRVLDMLSNVSIWPGKAEARDVVSYAEEADALGLVRLVKSETIGDAYLEPRLRTGIEVVDRLLDVGFNVLVANPTRAWIPILTVYGDVTTKFPTVEEVLDGRTPLLSVLQDIVKKERVERWVKHMLGLGKSLKIPALAVDAPYRTLGVISVVKIGDERRLLSLTAARRIIGRSVGGGDSINELYRQAEKRVRGVLEGSGVYANILKTFIEKGFLNKDEAYKLARTYIGDKPEVALRDLESVGLIHSTNIGYYSAWTITPVYDEMSEPARDLLAWMYLELQGHEREVYDGILRRLVERGEADIASQLDFKHLVRVIRSLSSLEKMGLIRFEGEERVRVTDDNARKLLQTAYIAIMLGKKLIDVPHENKRVDIREVIANEIPP